jgi:hypothetical protein
MLRDFRIVHLSNPKWANGFSAPGALNKRILPLSQGVETVLFS